MSSDSDVSSDSGAVIRCSYCYKARELVDGKSYCQSCLDNCFKECRRCKKPYHDKKYFSHSDKRCNGCHAKYLKERMAREDRKRKLQDGKKHEGISGKHPCEASTSNPSQRKIIGYLAVHTTEEE